MECTTAKNRVIDTLIEVNKVSVSKKPNQQEAINSFLDRILDLKEKLKEKAEKLFAIGDMVGNVTRLQNLTKEEMNGVKEIVHLLGVIVDSDKKYFFYASNAIRKNKLSTVELNLFKNALDDIIERRQDINDRFFVLPGDEEFVNDLKELESL